ncbi:cytochrome c-type biogenesis protein [Methylocucumis oryzae]|uniref:cytochrome c-type biogenesis protein n=1 Tax=Methylocucumis oryzae TaxID=1632867 RepID=UPI0009E49E9F|nr:cytochrome c-type biogenesis protein [Methylocucumis oryzae]
MRLLLLLSLLCPVTTALAIDTLRFDNATQQAEYENITSELRCLVCQNQTIADSNAELAADLRRQVYEMLQQGRSQDEILRFMTDRYGDFVLYNPPFKAKTGVLWLGPVAFLIVGLISVGLVIKHKRKTKPEQAVTSLI